MRIAVLCMHTSPLAQPGTGDVGGMNVYVRELTSSLARAGVECDVYVRADDPAMPPTICVEPGFRVHHVVAGPVAPVEKELLRSLVPLFADAVERHLVQHDIRPDVLHANYWLSGEAGHTLKHRLNIPLVSTFHTLARVKTAGDDPEPEERAVAEQHIIGCSELVFASCSVERDQLIHLYGADPDRVVEVPLGINRAFFSPGSRQGARAAIGDISPGPLLLFAGRIQPLKGADLAVEILADLQRSDVTLLIVGGPSGRGGELEVVRLHELVRARGLTGQVRFVPPQPHHLLSTFYRAADAVLVPSRSESFGLVALEAAACGTPVIAAAVGGLQTLVDHGSTGWLVPERNPQRYADHLRTLFGDPVLAARMGDAAAMRARRYAWSATAARLREAFVGLTERALVLCQ